MNLLLGGLCVLIPIVGPIVLTGWLVTYFWGGAAGVGGGAARDFDFNQFTKYLERGLWPFLVVFIVSMVGVPIVWILMFVPMLGSGMMAAAAGGRGSGCFIGMGWLVMMLLMLVYVLGISLLLTPLKIRAAMTQNFAQAFKFAWIKHFIVLMWKEILISWLFLFAANLVLCFAGFLALCIGIYFAMVPSYFAWMHLSKQLYALYVSRGGEPVPISPTLAVG